MNKDILDTFKLIENDLKEQLRSRQAQLDSKDREKEYDFIIQRLHGCLIGLNDAIYSVKMVKEQYDYKLKQLKTNV